MTLSRLISAGAVAVLLGSLISAAQAQTTAFNDTFSAASTVNANPSSPTDSTVTAASYQQIAAKVYNPAPPVIEPGNLRFGIVSTSSGFNHVQALFTKYPVTLVNVGDFIELTVVFNTEGGIITAQTNSTLFFGLMNAGQVQPIPGGIANSTAAVAGYAQTWQGYVNRLFYTGGNNGFFTRPAKLATDANNQDVLYNYGGGATVGSTAASTLATFTAGDHYTEVFRITRASATTLTLSSSLYSGMTAAGTPLYTQSATSSSVLTAVFDAFAFGWRGTGSVASVMNVKSVKIITTGTTTIIPEITTQPLSVTKMVGESVTLSVVADGGAGTTLSYQWRKGGGDIGGATGANYTIDSVALADAGDYSVVVTDVAGSTTSSTATLTVTSGAVAPSIAVEPVGATILVGGAHTFGVTANGTAPLSYQWHISTDAGVNFTPVSGATTDSLAISGAALADAGLYRVVVTNAQGSATSAAAALVVNQAPAITGQPSGASLAIGGSHTFTVTASGTPAPTYQWRRNGTAISGATSASYTVSSASGADSGNYAVVVSNTVGSVTSSSASLVVLSASMATTAVTPVHAATGLHPDTRLTITFNEAVTPGVSGFLRIHDAADDSVVDTIDLVAATVARDTLRASSTLSTQLLPVQNKPIGGIANNFNYYPITVSGSTATIHPRNGVLAYGKTYYVRIDAGVFVNAAGESFAGISDSTTWRFSTRASGPAGGTTDLTVAADGSGDFLTLQAALDFIPANNTVPTTIRIRNGTYFEEIGFQSKHFVTILGEDVDQTIITYPNNNTFNNVSGIYHRAVMVAQSVHDFTLANLTIINATPQNGSQAEAIVINGSGAASAHNLVTRCKFYSYQDTVLFNKQTYISDTTIEGDVDFMWGDGPAFFENCDIRILRTGGYFTQIRNPASNHGFVYRNCRFTAPAGISGTYFGRIDPAGFPASEVVILDSRVGDATNNALLATTTGVSGSNYLGAWWMLNNVGSAASASGVHNWANNLVDGTGAALSNPNTDTFTTMPSDATTQTNYRDSVWVLNTSIAGAVNGTWTPALAPLVVTQPASVAVDAGQAASFAVAVVGVPAATYQWNKDGSPISGATSATYAIAAAAPSDAAGYTVTVTNANGTVSSAVATLTVNGTIVSPTIITPPASGDVALGAPVTLSVIASGTAPLSYQWYKGDAPISGATASSYTISAAVLEDSGSYTVTVTNVGGSVTSAAAVITVKVVGASSPSGYAAAVTGGAAGTTVMVSTAAELRSYAESSNPHTIIVSGTIDLGANGRVRPKSNKTIKGADVAATILGTVTIDNADNVILSNLNISANTGDPATNDGVTIAASTNVLVTKCTIYDCTDGNLDVINGSDLVTISWCKFYYTRDNGHNFSNLVGSSDTDIGTGDGLSNYRVTWHHNWWSTGAKQRMIACRFGSAHMFNNYWDCSGNDYATESRNLASILSEHNVYSNVDDPLGKRTALPTDLGLLMTIGNVFTNCTGNQAVGDDEIFVPPYSYRLDATASLAAAVQAGAGNSVVDSPAWATASISGTVSTVATGGSVSLTAVPAGFTPISYQWRFKNQAISGATSATLAISSAQAGDAGSYSVVIGLADGDAVVSTPFALAVEATGVSVSTPSTTGTAGEGMTLTAAVSGVTPTAYQWQLDGVDIAGATSATYTLPHVQAFQAGTYRVIVTHAGGTLTSAGTPITVNAPPASDARLTNLSTRALAGTGDAVMIPGFIIEGTGTKQLLIRAVGPELVRFHVDGVLANPRMVLKRHDPVTDTYTELLSNDDWGTNANADDIVTTAAAVGAFSLTSGSQDAVLLTSLGAGRYTVVADGADGGTGVALVELYDADPGSPTARLVNISNRGQVASGGRIMIPGFVVSDEGPRTFLLRAVGPRLAGFGVADVLADPQLIVYRRDPVTGDDYAFLSNDDWGTNPGAATTASVAQQVGAFSLTAGSKDAAFVATLPPGIYTVHAIGAGDTTGVALVEVYLVP